MTELLDIRLDADGDIAFADGDLRLDDDPAQRVQRRLRLIEGEWFLDLSAGVPWLTEILGRGATPARIRTLLREEILGTPGIVVVERLDVDFDRAGRRLSATFRALGPERAAIEAAVDVQL